MKIISFTLIELLITTSFILTFGALSLAYYNNFTQEKSLRNEASKLANILEIARKKAVSGDLSGRVCNGGFNSYQVNVTNSSYSLQLRCGGNPVLPLIFSYSFPANISIINGANNYYFLKLSGKVETQNNSQNNQIITIKNLSIAKCLDINISSFGIITISNNFSSC